MPRKERTTREKIQRAARITGAVKPQPRQRVIIIHYGTVTPDPVSFEYYMQYRTILRGQGASVWIDGIRVM